MTSWIIINITLNIITFLNSLFTCIISIGILLIIIIFHRQTRSVPLLLASHTCLAMLLASIMLASMAISSLYGFIGNQLSEYDSTIWCYCRGFLVHGFLCVAYDSYIVQAGYRVCRVVFYRRKAWYSFKLYCFIIPFEIIFALICISPVVIFNRFIYIQSEYYCQTPFTDLPAILYVAARLYAFPIISLFGIYIYLVKYIRQINPLIETVDTRLRVRNNARDLTVIKRLLIILILLLFLGLPSMIFLIMFLFTGHLVSITYRIGWLVASFSSVFLVLTVIIYTTPLRETVKRLIHHIGILRCRLIPQQPVQTRNQTK